MLFEPSCYYFHSLNLEGFYVKVPSNLLSFSKVEFGGVVLMCSIRIQQHGILLGCLYARESQVLAMALDLSVDEDSPALILRRLQRSGWEPRHSKIEEVSSLSVSVMGWGKFIG